MFIEPIWLPGCRRARATACRRCGSTQIRGLGHAGSTLLWFACDTCSHVWSISDREDDESTQPESLPLPAPIPHGREH
jgi:hypothetical protein